MKITGSSVRPGLRGPSAAHPMTSQLVRASFYPMSTQWNLLSRSAEDVPTSVAAHLHHQGSVFLKFPACQAR